MSSEERTGIPIDWSPIDAVPAIYVNQMLAQVIDQEIFLAFGQTTPPPFVGSGEDMVAQLQGLDSVAVKPVSRLVLTADTAAALLQVLGESLARYEEQRAAKQAAAAAGD